MHHDHRRLCVSCIRNRGRLDLPYVAGASRGRREAGYMSSMLLVWRGVGCKDWRDLSVRRHSCTRRKHRVELWRIADWLKNSKKNIEVKQNRQLGCTWYVGFIREKQAQCVLDQWQGSCGVRFLLDFSIYLFLAPNGQGIPVFGRCPFLIVTFYVFVFHILIPASIICFCVSSICVLVLVVLFMRFFAILCSESRARLKSAHE